VHYTNILLKILQFRLTNLLSTSDEADSIAISNSEDVAGHNSGKMHSDPKVSPQMTPSNPLQKILHRFTNLFQKLYSKALQLPQATCSNTSRNSSKNSSQQGSQVSTPYPTPPSSPSPNSTPCMNVHSNLQSSLPLSHLQSMHSKAQSTFSPFPYPRYLKRVIKNAKDDISSFLSHLSTLVTNECSINEKSFLQYANESCKMQDNFDSKLIDDTIEADNVEKTNANFSDAHLQDVQSATLLRNRSMTMDDRILSVNDAGIKSIAFASLLSNFGPNHSKSINSSIRPESNNLHSVAFHERNASTRMRADSAADSNISQAIESTVHNSNKCKFRLFSEAFQLPSVSQLNASFKQTISRHLFKGIYCSLFALYVAKTAKMDFVFDIKKQPYFNANYEALGLNPTLILGKVNQDASNNKFGTSLLNSNADISLLESNVHKLDANDPYFAAINIFSSIQDMHDPIDKLSTVRNDNVIVIDVVFVKGNRLPFNCFCNSPSIFAFVFHVCLFIPRYHQ
jgi:hypothetical protein